MGTPPPGGRFPFASFCEEVPSDKLGLAGATGTLINHHIQIVTIHL